MAPRAAAIAAAAAAAAVVVAIALLRRRRRKKALPPGLTLFERVLDAGACDALVRVVDDLAARGARGELGPRCYTPVSSPSFAERRQSRVMLQFGAYANANRVENAATAPLPRARRKVHDRGFAAVMTSMIFLSQSIFYAQMPFHAVSSLPRS